MAVTTLDSIILNDAPADQIHEDLMDQIYDVSREDRPLCDSFGSRTSTSRSVDWVREQLAVASADNASVEGADAADDDNQTGERLYNFHQLSDKVVKVSDRAVNTNTVGTSDELIKQVMKRQKELRRDEEARYASRGIAIAGVSDTTASTTAGVGGWIGVKKVVGGVEVVSNTSDRGATTGADPVLSQDGTGGGFPTTIAVSGTARALT